jgi:Fe-S cluster biogenesis protein NfuA
LSSEDSARQAVEQLREGFQADGADLELQSLEDGVARVRLVVTDETCLECIVPGDILQTVVEASLRQAVPELRGVVLDDPRPPEPA